MSSPVGLLRRRARRRDGKRTRLSADLPLCCAGRPRYARPLPRLSPRGLVARREIANGRNPKRYFTYIAPVCVRCQEPRISFCVHGTTSVKLEREFHFTPVKSQKEMHSVNKKVMALMGMGLLTCGSSAFAQYTMNLTGVGTGTIADGVYVSPYQGTIQGNGVDYAGYVICDDFNTESVLNKPWSAITTNAGALNGTQKFQSDITFNGNIYSTQQSYDAAAWLANGLLDNLGSAGAQVDYSFALWNIFDGKQTDPNGGAVALENAAFSAVLNGYVGSNVAVFTPTPINASQEFLVVTKAPEIDPASAASGLTLLIGGLAVMRGRRQLSC